MANISNTCGELHLVNRGKKAYKKGLCNPAQSAFWEQKPPEELYDVTKDPSEINNLAYKPKTTMQFLKECEKKQIAGC